jgi:hypothetical protein
MARFSVVACCILATVASSFALAAPGTARDIKAIKESLQGRLKDPDSAKIKGVVVAPDGTICGFLNAKNSYGAYIGFEPFIGMKLTPDKFFFLGTGDASAQMCAEKGIMPKV